MDSIRVSELAKELGLTSKEVIEKFGEISIIVKSHSNTVTPVQIRKLKEHLGVLPKKSSAKPKAFIVKKSKAPAAEATVETAEKPKKPEAPKIERVQRVQRVEKVEKIEKVEPKVSESKPSAEAPVEKKVEKPAIRIERTKIEYPKNQSRIEIVRKAPPKPAQTDRNKDGKPAERGDKKPFNKGAQEKKLVERRIIPQEIYEGKGNNSKRKVDPRKHRRFK